MKNLIVNIFKTLFFFDFALVVVYYLPTIKNANPALQMLINEGLVMVVLAVFTFVFLRFVEKRKLKLNREKFKFKNFLLAIVSGMALPVITVCLIKLLKGFDYIGFNKVSHLYYWIIALLLNAIAGELFFRGYLFSLYKKYYGFLTATVVTTLLYLSANTELFKTSKILAANIILFNILLCLLLEFTGNLAVSVIARFIYLALSTFMLGSLNLRTEYPVLVNTVFNGKALITGGEKGIENSLIMLCLTTIITLFLLHKKYNLIKKIKFAVNYTKNKFKSLNHRVK